MDRQCYTNYMDQLQIAWVAGLLEGEGTFVRRSGNSCVISCEMTDKDTIQKLFSFVGAGNIYFCPSRNEAWKDTWKWQLTDSMCILELLQSIYPWMSDRRKIAIDIVLSTVRKTVDKNTYRLDLYESIRQSKIDFPLLSYRQLATIHGVSRSSVQRALVDRSRSIKR